MRITKFISTFVLLWVTWIVLTQSFKLQEVLVGAAASGVVAMLSHRVLLLGRGEGESFSLDSWIAAPIYGLVYIYCEIKAHAEVIYLILHPQMPINPGVVKVTTELKSDFGITALANSITMTPGTLTVDIDEEESAVFVHWINVRTTDRHEVTKQIAGQFESYLRRIFG